MGDARKRKIDMSAKTLIIATAALAASTAMTLPAFAAAGDGTGPNGTGPGPANPPAAAQTVQPRATIMFNLLDTNHDGSISKEEFAVLSNATFESLDTNHDGKLEPNELRGRFGPGLAQRGNRGGPGMFQGRNWQDRDGRGWNRGPGMMGRMGFNGPGPQQGAGQQAPGPRLSFNDIDTNHDGVISQDEFNAHQQAFGQWRGLGWRR